MTAQEAIKRLQYERPAREYHSNLNEVFDMAIEALEKQIHKKPLQIITDDNEYICMICPSCQQIAVDLDDIHCWKCGQKLDWSEEDEQ